MYYWLLFFFFGWFFNRDTSYRSNTPIISPNTSNENFEIAFKFIVIERLENYVYGNDSPPTDLFKENVAILASKGAH